MRAPEEIEEMLGRLMPVAVSEEGQRSMDAMLDELCGPDEVEVPAVEKRRYWKYLVAPAGIAAATAFVFFHPAERASKPVEIAVPVQGLEVDEMALMGESDRIEALADEGLVADSGGGVMQAVRVRVVGEDTFRDEETGIVVQISEPREEMLYYQVNGF